MIAYSTYECGNSGLWFILFLLALAGVILWVKTKEK